MSFADDKFLPTGAYAIIHAEHNLSVSFSERDQSPSPSSAHDYGWSVSFLKNKKWTIQGPSDISIELGPDAEEGEDVIWAKNPPKPHQWVIKRHSNAEQSYIIYSPTQSGLFWSLPNADKGTIPQLSSDYDSVFSLWKFKKIEKPAADGDVSTAPPKATENRDQKQVACGGSSNLVRVRRTIAGALETQDLVSGWDATDRVMTLDGTDSDALALPSVDDSYILVLDAFHSKNSAKKDPHLSTNLRVFAIFDESEGQPGSSRTQNAIIKVHSSIKVSVDLNDPGKPDPNSVNKGYNEELDLPRPSSMDQLLELRVFSSVHTNNIHSLYRKYRVVFVVDYSSAMAVNGAWGKAKEAVIRIVAETMQYDTNGIDLYFLNSMLHREGVVAPDEVTRIFGQIKPQGPLSTGARLESVLNKILLQLEQAKDNSSAYGQIKPTNVVVLTNSSPSDDAAKALRVASQKLKRGLHHPNAVGIQFAQIENDNIVQQALRKLSQDPSFSRESLKSCSWCDAPVFYYRVFNSDGAMATKRPAYMDNLYLGCIMPRWVAPPHHARSLRICLSTMENIDPSKTRLFATSSSQPALRDGTPASLSASQTLGLTPAEPLALLSEVVPQPGVKAGTGSFRVPPETESPLAPRFLYYGVYTEGGALASKKPINTQEAWVSRIDLDFIPPPLSVASLKRTISANEGMTSSSEIFVDNATTTPLSDDHVLIKDGDWLGSTADEHVVFKFGARSNDTTTTTTWNRFRIDSNYTLILGNGHSSDWDHVYVATSGLGYYGRLEDADGPFHRSRVRNVQGLVHVKKIELLSVGPVFASSPANLSFSRLT
ncbi:hypothetical protein GALMADRAFT_205284 [Galerina marginata CBS 339.88]|uniref:VWFA domain-containing protein n=1 Tax=Galerina marginata (strain CBS 339.88) TaxID=685588 RepID=A0A067TSE7_GALM3|nr:hypothetical protein GALMADRAFT_205284 [Galerina marginata CBS 339.88]